MGLDYLQKKNWHPGSIRNQEIVWIREELQKEIIKRVREVNISNPLGTRKSQKTIRRKAYGRIKKTLSRSWFDPKISLRKNGVDVHV